MHQIHRGILVGCSVLPFLGAFRAPHASSDPHLDERHHALRAALSPYRDEEIVMRKRWEDDEESGYRKLPPRAWPPYQPPAAALPLLSQQAMACPKNVTTPQLLPSSSQLQQHTDIDCNKALFDLATCLAFNNIDGPAAFKQYQALADTGHLESQVAVGVLLVDGIGCECNVEAGVAHLAIAAKANNAQGLFELGTAVYIEAVQCMPDLETGEIQQISDSNATAFALFEKAAAQAHVGGSFMTGEMLLDGEGCEPNVARAIPLVMLAAEAGHRFGRQRIRHLMDRTR